MPALAFSAIPLIALFLQQAAMVLRIHSLVHCTRADHLRTWQVIMYYQLLSPLIKAWQAAPSAVLGSPITSLLAMQQA